MGAIASIVTAISIIAVIYGLIMRRKASRITKADHMQSGAASSAANGKAVSVQGRPVAQPLVSPVTGTACLYYEVQVEGFWKDGDTKKSKTYHEDKQGHVGVDDGSGVLPLDLAGGGDFDLKKTFEEKHKEGMFDDLKNAVGKGKPVIFGNFHFQNPVGSKANEFVCTEKVFTADGGAVYANGYMKEGVLSGKAIFSLLVSDKSREQLLDDAMGTAKKALMGGGIGVGVGILLGVISNFL
jgi:hypothetical protein